jgi:small subunit ribosomal protein S2
MSKIPSLQDLLEAGVHFGHKVSRGNPRMSPYIYGAREGVHIIDLTLSEKMLKEAANFAESLGKEGKSLLFVGTKKQAQEIIEESAKSVGAPYLSNKWVGGFLTNFEEISKNILKLKEIKEQKEKGTLKKYTKKEQLLITRRANDLQKVLGGVAELDKLPDAVFILDANKDAGAVREANRVGVKIIAVTDTNSDPTLVDYPIPANDDAIKSIKIMVDTITKAFEEGQQAAGKKAEKDAADAEKVKAAAVAKEEKKSVEEELPEEIIEEVAAAEEIVEKKSLEDSERKA